MVGWLAGRQITGQFEFSNPHNSILHCLTEVQCNLEVCNKNDKTIIVIQISLL